MVHGSFPRAVRIDSRGSTPMPAILTRGSLAWQSDETIVILTTSRAGPGDAGPTGNDGSSGLVAAGLNGGRMVAKDDNGT